jgi:NTP pyrophosphatase (non-canonical NTP hydrolase)
MAQNLFNASIPFFIMKNFPDAQKEVDILVQQMGGYWSPLAMLASVVEEVGELAREINALEKIKIKKPEERIKPIEEELADTLFSIICIANHYQVDLGASLDRVINKYRIRDMNRFAKNDP